MAVSSSTWILTLKIVLISIGAVSIAIMVKFSVPLIVGFAVNEIPQIWSNLVSWMRPPYLYFVINAIIITIAATSRFHRRHHEDDKIESEPLLSSNAPPSDLHLEEPLLSLNTPPSDLHSDVVAASASSESPAAAHESEASEDVKTVVMMNGAEDEGDDGDAFVISSSIWTPSETIDTPLIQSEYLLPSAEKPLVTSRFAHRKPVKASPEGGRALRVAKPKRQDTLEATWKTITDGRHMPLTRHLKKSDTWENHGSQFEQSPINNVKKSETFRDRTNYNDAHPPPSSSSVNSSPGLGRLRKELSLSQDELNRRVEAFIKKFNDEMRLQRQESLNQYMEMINRGAH